MPIRRDNFLQLLAAEKFLVMSLPRRLLRFVSLLGLVLSMAFSVVGILLFPRLRDFAAFIAAGYSASHGLDLYSEASLNLLAAQGYAVETAPNLNPPISVLLFYPFQYLTPWQGLRALQVLSAVAYALTLALLIRRYPVSKMKVVWALACTGLWMTLVMGQIYVLLGLVIVAAWVQSEDAHWNLAGLLIGCTIAIKPIFAVWAILLLVAGHRRPAIVAIATAAGLSLIPLIAFGPGAYIGWLRVIQAYPYLFSVPLQASLPFLLVDFPALSWPICALVLAASTVLVYRKAPDAVEVTALALAVTLLVSPLAWTGYLVVLIPIFMTFRWSIPMALAGIIFAIPANLMLLGLTHVPFVRTLYVVGVALTLVAVFLQATQEHSRAGLLRSELGLT